MMSFLDDAGLKLSPSDQSPGRTRLCALIAVVAVLAAGCAPDALNNRAATPFDAFVNKVSKACAPIQLGRYRLADPLEGGGGGSYDYWLDQTSRLFYRRIPPAAYRQSLTAFFGAGNDGTIDCILDNLPPPS